MSSLHLVGDKTRTKTSAQAESFECWCRCNSGLLATSSFSAANHYRAEGQQNGLDFGVCSDLHSYDKADFLLAELPDHNRQINRLEQQVVSVIAPMQQGDHHRWPYISSIDETGSDGGGIVPAGKVHAILAANNGSQQSHEECRETVSS